MAVIPGCCLVLCIPPTNSTNLLTDHRLLPKCPLATKVLARPLRNYRNPSPGPKAETNDSASAPRALNALGTPTIATAPITIRLARGHRSLPCNTVRSSMFLAVLCRAGISRCRPGGAINKHPVAQMPMRWGAIASSWSTIAQYLEEA